LGLKVNTLQGLTYCTTKKETENLPARSIANITFDLQDLAGTWKQYYKQVVVTDIGTDMLLGMPWLTWHNPQILFKPVGLYHLTKISNLAALLEPVFLDKLIEGKKPLMITTLCVEDNKVVFEDKPFIPEAYQDLADIFNADKAWELPPYKKGHDFPINLEPGTQLSHKPLYCLLPKEVEALRKYVNKYLAHGFLRPSTSAIGAPVLFVPKKDGGLRLCVDYCKLLLTIY
jgi:hypothetical protein